MKLLLLAAMARQEGGIGLHGEIPAANSRQAQACNPGDIEAGKFAAAHGAVGSFGNHGRFARFRNLTDGYKAMAALLSGPRYRGRTIQQAIYLWLGYNLDDAGNAVTKPNEPGNYPAVYIAHVCEWTGLAAAEVIDSHLQIPGANPVA